MPTKKQLIEQLQNAGVMIEGTESKAMLEEMWNATLVIRGEVAQDEPQQSSTPKQPTTRKPLSVSQKRITPHQILNK